MTTSMADHHTPPDADIELAVLGVELRGAVRQLGETAARLEAAQRHTDKQVEELRREVLHYKGVIGGAMFVFGGMWAALLAFKGWLFGEVIK